MPDDILVNKAATIERCVARAQEEYHRERAADLKRMVGFRNVAAHDSCHQALQLPITVAVITRRLGEFLRYTEALLRKDGASS